MVGERALPQRGQHGQDLGAGAARGGPHLAQVGAVHRDRDVDVDDRSTLYVGDELRGRPLSGLPVML